MTTDAACDWCQAPLYDVPRVGEMAEDGLCHDCTEAFIALYLAENDEESDAERRGPDRRVCGGGPENGGALGHGNRALWVTESLAPVAPLVFL